MRVKLALVLTVGLGIIAGVAAVSASSSPGGGHHCWTRCSRYGMYTGQYHCHRSPCSRADIRRHRAHGH